MKSFADRSSFNLFHQQKTGSLKKLKGIKILCRIKLKQKLPSHFNGK